MNRILIAVGALVLWTVAAFFAGREWRDRSADLAESKQQTDAVKQTLTAEQSARAVEQKQAAGVQSAADSADSREEKINADYEARLAAAVAGRDSELGKLRKQWASSATACLASNSAAAAEAAEEDRLRRASAARIVRAVELAQSERDEVIDRYEAIRTAEVTK